MSELRAPKNGLLSGMAITAGTAIVVIGLSLASPSFLARFAAPLSRSLLWGVGATMLVMVAHKAESFWFGEFDQCPVYRTSGTAWADNVRKAIFVSFVLTFLGMLGLLFCALMGPPWHLVIVTIWLGQGLHELHHSAKSIARRRIYPGLFTSIVFVGMVALWVFPEWYRLVIGEGAYWAWYAVMPVVLVAFYLEDRSWIAAASPEIWRPTARAA